MPLWQLKLWQSDPTRQVAKFAQAAHEGPPQSTDVSVPFFTPSVHIAPAQVPFEQTPVVQSPPEMHESPVAHLGHEPPQSLSVSAPFFVPSVHVGARQVPLVHTLL